MGQKSVSELTKFFQEIIAQNAQEGARSFPADKEGLAAKLALDAQNMVSSLVDAKFKAAAAAKSSLIESIKSRPLITVIVGLTASLGLFVIGKKFFPGASKPDITVLNDQQVADTMEAFAKSKGIWIIQIPLAVKKALIVTTTTIGLFVGLFFLVNFAIKHQLKQYGVDLKETEKKVLTEPGNKRKEQTVLQLVPYKKQDGKTLYVQAEVHSETQEVRLVKDASGEPKIFTKKDAEI